jgi:hypothetical protein
MNQVSAWFLFIYALMAVLPSWNQSAALLSIKFLLGTGVISLLTFQPIVFHTLAQGVAVATGSRWDVDEWFFRFALDRWIVVVGMLTAWVVIASKDAVTAMSDHRFAFWHRIAGILAVLSLIAYLAFALSMPDKVI